MKTHQSVRHARRAGWFDDPLIERERAWPDPVGPRPGVPLVQDHHASVVLYDARERPIRRQIGFGGGHR